MIVDKILHYVTMLTLYLLFILKSKEKDRTKLSL